MNSIKIFFDEIDKIENKISNGDDFQSIIQNIKTDIKRIDRVHSEFN
jgi:peptidyl-prolyl cis-trans isomerase D